MNDDLINTDQQNTVQQSKLSPQLQSTSDLSSSEQATQSSQNKKLLICLAVIIFLISVIGVSVATGYLKLGKTNNLITLAQEKHETSSFEVSLPKDWSAVIENGGIIATQTGNTIRKVTITPTFYDETLISRFCKSITPEKVPDKSSQDPDNVDQDSWIKYCDTSSPNPPIKENHVYRSRWLTSECHIDKTIGDYCDRIYYLWNVEQLMMAKMEIQWEKWSLEEIAKSEESFRKAQSEGLPKAHPSIDSMEEKIFNSFRFKLT